jgi:hypothetical protein
MTVEEDRSARGLVIRGRILRFGPLPPSAGPARTQWCVDHGLTSLMNGRRSYAIALRGIIRHLPNGLLDLPPIYPLHELHTEEAALDIGRRRVKSWFGLRNRLDSFDECMRRLKSRLLDAQWEAALQNIADSFNWLDDARQDLGQEQLVDVTSFTGQSTTSRSIGALVDLAHAAVHSAGELAGGLFGCRMIYDNGRWYDECVVELLHLRFGNSVGMRVRYECSVCGNDPGDCEHQPGQAYLVHAAHNIDGKCTVCDVRECTAHQLGNAYDVIADAKIIDPKLYEVSITPRPRDPLARISGRSVETDDLRIRLGRIPDSDDVVLDHACMYPCRGFREMPN